VTELGHEGLPPRCFTVLFVVPTIRDEGRVAARSLEGV
jgi:hypothetical protein